MDSINYRIFFAHNTQPLMVADLQSRPVESNHAFRKLLGYSAEELASIPIANLAHEEDAEKTYQAFRQLLSDQHILAFQARMVNKQGRTLHVMWNAYLDAESRLIYASCTDVSENRRIERLLQETSEMASVGGWEYDLRSEKIMWTEQMYRIHDVSPAHFELDLGSALSFFHNDDRPMLAQKIRLAIEQRQPYDVELRIVTGQGQPKWVRAIGKVVTHRDEAIKIVGTYQDINRRKLAELAVERSQRFIRQVMDVIPAAVAWADEQLRYQGANPLFLEMNGLDEAALAGKTNKDMAWADKASIWQLYMVQAFHQQKIVYGGTENFRDAQGKERWVRLHCLPLYDDEGYPNGVLLAMDEVSEEEQYKHELLRSNQELEQFAYIASHDLQEPLRKVMNFSERIAHHEAGQLSPRSLDYMARMRASVMRMQNLIDDLLRYSRVLGKRGVQEAVDLNAVLQDILSDMEVSLQDQQASIELGPLPSVQGVRLNMRQLFQNLISNAIKFRRPDVPPRVRIACHSTPGRHCIEVADNGIGMDEKYADRIFKPFQRLHSREQYAGTGIGLAICQKIVEQHGGQISVRSRPGEGAVFSVLLPAL